MTKQAIEDMLNSHAKWLNNEYGGQRANMRDMDLWGADMQRANMQGVNMQGANMRCANMQGANMQDADMRDMDLRGVDMQDADMRRANMQGANMRCADMWGADMLGADMRGADIDYACWPLWCGSFDVIVDARIAAQLAYHFCRLVCDDPMYIAARNAIVEFANQFHRVDECGRLEKIEVPINAE